MPLLKLKLIGIIFGTCQTNIIFNFILAEANISFIGTLVNSRRPTPTIKMIYVKINSGKFFQTIVCSAQTYLRLKINMLIVRTYIVLMFASRFAYVNTY